MRKTTICWILGVGYWIFFSLAFHCLASDWPQYQRDAQRTGYTPDSPAPPYKAAWSYRFAPERLHVLAQPVVCGRRVFLGTMNGNLYAFDAVEGETLWKAGLGTYAGVMHASGCAGDLAIVACMDGSVRAFQALDGTPAWTFQASPAKGFSTAPCLADGRIFIGNRNGVFYALDIKTGAKLWERDTGAPILNTAAYNEGRVVFGNEDMTVFSLDANTGGIAWSSQDVTGASFTDHCPVIHGGRVLVRPAPLRSPKYDVSQMNLRAPVNDESWTYGPGIPWLHVSLYGNYRAYVLSSWQSVADERKTDTDREVENLIMALSEGEMPDEILDAQEQYMKYLENNPHERQFFALDEKTGKMLPPLISFLSASLCGSMAPPAMTADGRLVVPWKYPNACWALLDPETGRAVRIMPAGWPTNFDETACVSVGGARVFAIHYRYDGSIGINAIFDLELNRWVPTSLGGRNAPVHGAPAGMGDRREVCGSSTHAAAIGGNMFFHAIYDTLYAAEGAEEK